MVGVIHPGECLMGAKPLRDAVGWGCALMEQ